MSLAPSQSCGEHTIQTSEMNEQAAYPVLSSPWSAPYGVLDTDGGMPLDITFEVLSEDEEDERHCREVVAPRRNEPTLSSEEVKRELKKDGLL